MIRKLLPSVLLAALFLLGGCADDQEDYGIVARVNGEPVYLEELDFRHDISHVESAGDYVPTVEQLRSEYGSILADMIVQELVEQELERRGLEVTEEEMQRAEERILADYPDRETFEQVLVEEYVDIDDWRRELEAREVMEKFQQQVLRPQIKIDYKEAEEYYHENIGEFYLPRRYRILVVRGDNKAAVEKVAKSYAGADDEELASEDGVVTRESVVRADRVPGTWSEELEKGEPGEALSVSSDRAGFERVVLLEKYPPKVLPPTQAYPLVEEVLLEQKLGAAFDDWLAQALSSASIEISEHLLEKSQESEALVPQEEAEMPAETSGDDSGEEEVAPDEMEEGQQAEQPVDTTTENGGDSQ